MKIVCDRRGARGVRPYCRFKTDEIAQTGTGLVAKRRDVLLRYLESGGLLQALPGLGPIAAAACFSNRPSLADQRTKQICIRLLALSSRLGKIRFGLVALSDRFLLCGLRNNALAGRLSFRPTWPTPPAKY
jgi:hypothetical protein